LIDSDALWLALVIFLLIVIVILFLNNR